MKVLFVGYHNPHFIALPEYIENAILRLGYELSIFDDRKFLLPGAIRTKVPFLRDLELKRINNNLLDQAKDFKPDICLINSLHRIKPETIYKLKAWGIKTAFIISDFPWDPQAVAIEAVNYDFVFYGGTEVEVILEKAGIKNKYWIPFACDEQMHKPLALKKPEQEKYGSDIAFVGTISPEIYPCRVKLLEAISDLDIKVWGPGAFLLPKNSPLHSRIKGQAIRPREWIKIYSAAKIGLCLHFRDPEGNRPCYQASPRVYELLASRCFALVDDQLDVKRIFEDNKHLVIFKDAKDLREKIDYYLRHDKQRQLIIDRGYKEVINKHTYTHRLKKIFSIIQGE